ncbi:MAG: HupE/UreJ family protein [Myxococcota bacterium]
MLLLLGHALAHPALSSAVSLEVRQDGVHLDMQVPLDQLLMATEIDDEAALAAYLEAHVHIEDVGGAELEHGPTEIQWGEVDGAEHLLASMELHTPDGSALGPFVLVDDVVVHRVVSHRIYVTVARDPWNGDPEEGPHLAGIIARYPSARLTIDRGAPSWWGVLASAFRSGAAHVAGGADHLLFLLTLLLATTHDRDPKPRNVVRGSALVISCFTVGHSSTLALAALGWVRPPAAWIEVAVAASIVLAAVHAIRPLWPRAELPLAAVFGLVHGLAFAEALSLAGVEVSAALLILVGFNIGVEVVQLGLAVVALPGLLLLASPRLAVARSALAAGALVLAMLWTLERLTALWAG